jgi:hypothetical protein
MEKARKTSLSRDTGSYGKELLLALVGVIAFDFTECGAPTCPGCVPCLGYLCGVGRYIFRNQQSQSTLRDQAFVVAIRNE